MSKCKVKKRIKAAKEIREMQYWRYILAKDKYWYGLVEGYFDSKNKLLFWTSEFEEIKVGEDEKPDTLFDLLDMLRKDLGLSFGKVLDLTISSKRAKEKYNA